MTSFSGIYKENWEQKYLKYLHFDQKRSMYKVGAYKDVATKKISNIKKKQNTLNCDEKQSF